MKMHCPYCGVEREVEKSEVTFFEGASRTIHLCLSCGAAVD